MTTLDKLLADLSAVLALLEADPDLATRQELERRRDDLREALRSIDVDEHRPTPEILEEYHHLAARIKKAKKEQVKKAGAKYAGATATVGGGVVPKNINEMINAGNRLEELEERFEHLQRILDERGALESTDSDSGRR